MCGGILHFARAFGDLVLARAIDRLPEEHYYYDSRADWVETNDKLPKLGGAHGIQPLD